MDLALLRRVIRHSASRSVREKSRIHLAEGAPGGGAFKYLFLRELTFHGHPDKAWHSSPRPFGGGIPFASTETVELVMVAHGWALSFTITNRCLEQKGITWSGSACICSKVKKRRLQGVPVQIRPASLRSFALIQLSWRHASSCIGVRVPFGQELCGCRVFLCIWSLPLHEVRLFQLRCNRKGMGSGGPADARRKLGLVSLEVGRGKACYLKMFRSGQEAFFSCVLHRISCCRHLWTIFQVTWLFGRTGNKPVPNLSGWNPPKKCIVYQKPNSFLKNGTCSSSRR